MGELWLYDSAGEFYGFILRGYRLVDGRYEPIAVGEIAPGVFQGYSPALNLNLRAADEYLGWHDPATGEHVPTLWSEIARADHAEARGRNRRGPSRNRRGEGRNRRGPGGAGAGSRNSPAARGRLAARPRNVVAGTLG